MTELERATRWDMVAGNSSVPDQNLDHPFVKLSINLVEEEVNGEGELLDSYYKNDLIGVLDGLGDTLKVVSQVCFALGVSPTHLLGVVNDSNFSKFCLNESDAKKSVIGYKEDKRYKDVHYKKVDGHYVILGWKHHQDVTKDTPKVLKGIHFEEPDLTRFIHK